MKQIALLRGINVGGRGKLPMAQLRAVLADLGAQDVTTYIQSGNVVFTGDITGAQISDAIEAAAGFRRPCFVLSADAFARAAKANPFPQAANDPKSLHLFFLSERSSAEQSALLAAKAPTERFELTDTVLYLHSPLGLSHSKLAEGLDRRLGVTTTGRNWATISNLLDLSK